jgi:hypothetical protein
MTVDPQSCRLLSSTMNDPSSHLCTALHTNLYDLFISHHEHAVLKGPIVIIEYFCFWLCNLRMFLLFI